MARGAQVKKIPSLSGATPSRALGEGAGEKGGVIRGVNSLGGSNWPDLPVVPKG